MKAVIDKRKCASDNHICKPMKECPVGAISWIEDEEELLGSRMEIDLRKMQWLWAVRSAMLWQLH